MYTFIDLLGNYIQEFIINFVARKSITPILTTSVPVVSIILEPAAGSAPNFFKVMGTIAPINPLSKQLAVMANKIIIDKGRACGLF